jgi:hypothetical protein
MTGIEISVREKMLEKVVVEFEDRREESRER